MDILGGGQESPAAATTRTKCEDEQLNRFILTTSRLNELFLNSRAHI
jgi:hypothetical protein